jgi:hypothetical protein
MDVFSLPLVCLFDSEHVDLTSSSCAWSVTDHGVIAQQEYIRSRAFAAMSARSAGSIMEVILLHRTALQLVWRHIQEVSDKILVMTVV